MSTPKERMETTEIIMDLAVSASNGNGHAKSYLLALMRATRIADDLADGDITEPEARAERTAELVDCLLIQIPTNPFFAGNVLLLSGVHLACLNAWRQSNRWWGRDEGRHEYADVWRDQILDVFAIVARLVGHPDPDQFNGYVRHKLKKQEPRPTNLSVAWQEGSQPIKANCEPAPGGLVDLIERAEVMLCNARPMDHYAWKDWNDMLYRWRNDKHAVGERWRSGKGIPPNPAVASGV